LAEDAAVLRERTSSAIAARHPSSCPCGSDYRHATVVETKFGAGATAHWLYEPACPMPKLALPLPAARIKIPVLQ